MSKTLKITFFLILTSCYQVYAETNSDDLDHNATELIQKFFNNSTTPGLVVSVGQGDKIIWSKGFGYADLEQKVRVDPALTKFRVGSISKPFTTFALGKLIDANQIDLDAEIQDYLPSFPKKKFPITVRQVTGHLSGIRSYVGKEFYSRKKYETVMDGLSIFKDDPLMHKPGEKWLYSSYGYNLLSAVIEKAVGIPYLDYMKNNVFLPIGMTQTVPDHIDSIIKNRGRYYRHKNNQYFNEPEVDNSNKWAGGGFLSTSDDLVRFGLVHLDDKYLSQSTIDTLWTSQKTSAGEITKYGVGWNIKPQENGQVWIGHGGGSVGGTTQFWLLQKEGLVIVMISNLSNFQYGEILLKLAEVFMENEQSRQ